LRPQGRNSGGAKALRQAGFAMLKAQLRM